MSVTDDFVPAIEAPPTIGIDVADVGTAAALIAEPAPNAGPRTQRTLSDSTRKLFATLAEKHKSEAGEGLEVDDLVPVDHDKSEATAGAVAATPTEPPATQTGTPPAVAAPAQEAAAKAIEHQRQVAADLREKALVERETAIATREKSLPSRERFLEKPGQTLRDLIKEFSGAETDADLKDAITDAISELTNETLGVPFDPQLKTAIESRKALRSVKAYKGDLAKQQAAIVADQKAIEQRQREAGAQHTLQTLLTQQQDKFPFLMAEENPHAIVWDILKTQYEKGEAAPNWESAASLAEKYFHDQANAFIAKRSRLLNPAAPTAQPAKTAVTQGVGPQNRQATQTKSAPASVTRDPDPQSAEPDRETKRRRSLTAMVAKLKEAAT